MKRVMLVVMLAVAGLLLAPASLLAAPVQQAGSQGIFGTLTEAAAEAEGGASLTVETNRGPVTLKATAQTAIRLAGHGAATLADLETGTAVAILARDGAAVNVLVTPGQPNQARHFSGAVIALGEDGSVTLQNPNGAQLTALLIPDTETGLAVGDLVTVVVKRDAGSGALIITGVVSADEALARLQAALERSGENNPSRQAALRQRLADQGASQLTALQRATRQDSQEIRQRIQARLDDAQTRIGQALAAAGAGRAAVQVTGVITVAPTANDQSVTIQPERGEAVALELTNNTVITLGRQTLATEQLEVGQRANARYQLDNKTATRIWLEPGAALERATALALLRAGAGAGEATGSLTIDRSATPPAIIITNPNGQVRLTLNEASQVRALGVPVALDSPLLAGQVTAQYDPETGVTIELNALAQEPPNDKAISGVVYQLIARPSLSGNLTVLTADGQLVDLNHIPETVFRRDGRQVTINEVRLGDLARPCSRYQESTRNLTLLCLRSPQPLPLQGIIQSVQAGHGGATLVTVASINLDMVTVTADAATQLRRQGRAMSASDLAAGARIVSGRYDPVSGYAQRLTVEAALQTTTRGEIIAVDRSGGNIIVGAGNGESVTLKVTAATQIMQPGRRQLTINDLEPGEVATQVIYDSGTLDIKLLALAPNLPRPGIIGGGPRP